MVPSLSSHILNNLSFLRIHNIFESLRIHNIFESHSHPTNW